MQAALALERNVNQALLDLHKTAQRNNDPQVRAHNVVLYSIFEFPLFYIFLLKDLNKLEHWKLSACLF